MAKKPLKRMVENPEDEWGHKKYTYAELDPAEFRRPADYTPARYMLIPCENCGDDIYKLKGVRGRNPKYHKSCKPLRNASFGHDPSTPFGRVGDPSLRKRQGPICGAPTGTKEASGDQGGVCCMPAGWGTQHNGFGQCKKHLGNAPNMELEAAKEMIFTKIFDPVYGLPIDTDPHIAIQLELNRTCGHIEWLRQMIAMLGMDPEGSQDQEIGPDQTLVPIGRDRVLHQMTNMGVQPSVWIQMYQGERKHLVQVAKAAVGMGISERAVKLAEDQGRVVALLLQQILNDDELGLLPEQRVKYPGVVRRLLLQMPTAIPIGAGE